ncbi:MAG TPA: cupin domain-containing protein [Thermoanaerobaculia bacterium]|nr:cupin domain-containing protein [Thermoanaerobaculia bacterium]
MRNESRLCRAMLAASWMLCATMFARGQTTDHAVIQNMAEMRFTAFPGMPSCTPGAVKAGDPSKGASIILARAETGCTVPWHWHSPNEHLMMVKGTARLDMKNEKSSMLRAGGFAMLPAKHAHQFVCTSSCLFYVYSDAAFDIHYVNDQGSEISPDEALKLSKRAPANNKKS